MCFLLFYVPSAVLQLRKDSLIETVCAWHSLCLVFCQLAGRNRGFLPDQTSQQNICFPKHKLYHVFLASTAKKKACTPYHFECWHHSCLAREDWLLLGLAGELHFL